MRGCVKISGRGEAHDLVDAAEAVNRHLFNEQLLDYPQYLSTLINDQRVWRHCSSSNESILSRLKSSSGSIVKDSARE